MRADARPHKPSMPPVRTPCAEGLFPALLILGQMGGARAAGLLRVHPDNARYPADGSGKVVHLTGFPYWDVVREDGLPDPEAMYFTEFLDIAERYGTNFVRRWRWSELAKFRYSYC